MVHLTVCSYHVTYTFYSESTLCSCLNVKEFLAQNRRNIWTLIDCNGTRTHNHLVHKLTLNHLAKLVKWLSCVVSTYLHSIFDCLSFSCQTCFRVNPHSVVAWMWRNSLLKTGAISEVRFTLKRVRDTIRTYSQMDHIDKYSRHSSIIWPVWLNDQVFVYKLSGREFKSSWSHLRI